MEIDSESDVLSEHSQQNQDTNILKVITILFMSHRI